MQQFEEVVADAGRSIGTTGTKPAHGGPHSITDEAVRDRGLLGLAKDTKSLPLP